LIGIHDPSLLDALEKLETPWKGLVWRQVIGQTDPLRPNARGARWNPPETEALYCSLSESGAQLELVSMLERQPVKVRKALRTHQLRVDVRRSADLRSGALADVGYENHILIADDWSVPQRMGAAAAWLGLAALIVPSARHDAGNIVLFVSELSPSDLVEPA